MFYRQNVLLLRQRVNAIRSAVVRLNSTAKSGNELKEVKVGETAAAPSVTEHAQVPQSTVQISGFSKYLVYKFSNKGYKSIEEVPDVVSSQQLNYAKDKGRARMTIVLIALTILGSVVAIFYGKSEHSKGKRHTDELLRQHAEYSRAGRDMLRKND